MAKTIGIRSNACTFGATTTTTQPDIILKATITPETADNKNVRWSMKWADGAKLSTTSVETYLTGKANPSNPLLYHIKCIKGFLGSDIILTVTTEEGNFTDTCTIKFVGVADTITVSSSTLQMINTSERGNYYGLEPNKSYEFNINMLNEYNSVGDSKLKATLSGVGEVYFGDSMSDDTGFNTTWRNVALHKINDRVNQYVKASISGNKLTLTMDKYTIEDNAGRYNDKVNNGQVEWDEGHISYYVLDEFYDQHVPDDYYNPIYDEKAIENFNRLKSCLFKVTVTDELGGASFTMPFFFKVPVDGVMIDSSVAEIR